MGRCTESLAIIVSISGVISSALYTYVYFVGQRATFFNEIQTHYASTEIMGSFDLLEDLLHTVGPEKYSSEFVRLKTLARKQEIGDLLAEGEAATPPTPRELELQSLGQRLDIARRRIFYYLVKLSSLEKLGYVPTDMLREFPGRTRAMHALRLLQPLVDASRSTYGLPMEEHLQVLDSVRSIFNITLAEQQGASSCSGGRCRDEL